MAGHVRQAKTRAHEGFYKRETCTCRRKNLRVQWDLHHDHDPLLYLMSGIEGWVVATGDREDGQEDVNAR